MVKRKLLNFRLALFILVSVSLGILFSYFLMLGKTTIAIALASVFLLTNCLFVLVFALNNRGRIKNLIFSLIFILSFLVGGAGFNTSINLYNKADISYHHYTIIGKVVETAQTESGQRLVLDRAIFTGVTSGNLEYKIKVYIVGDTSFDLGDIVKFSGYLKNLNAINNNKLSQYNLDNRIKYTTTIDASEVELLGNDKTIFESINVKIRDTLIVGLDFDEYSVGYALLTGNSDYMDGEIITSYRQTGVAHIFAVSGLHIGFLATALSLIFKKIRINRIVKIVIIATVLLLYAGVCAFSASSLRAVIMTVVLLSTSINGERYDPLSSVSIAGIILLIINPINLFCVGFQLSFTVVIGMILLSKPIAKLLRFLPNKLANSLGAVLSAQISSIPILLTVFGEFSLISVMANLIFIPFVSVIFIGLLVATIIGCVFSIPVITLFIPNYVLKFINFLITSIDYDVFMIGGFTMGAFIIVYYLVLLFLSGIINLSKIKRLIAVVSLSVVCIGGTIAVNVIDQNTPHVYVTGSYNVCASLIKEKDENLLVISYVNEHSKLNKLKSLLVDAQINKIDRLLLLNASEVDLQVLMTKLHKICLVSEFYYTSEKDVLLERVLKKSFPYVKVYCMEELTSVEDKSIKFYTLDNGMAVECKVRDKNIAIFASYDYDNVEYVGLNEFQHMIIAVNQEDYILRHYKTSSVITYLEGKRYLNAQTTGILKLGIK